MAGKSVGIKSFYEIPGPPRIPIWGNLHLYKLGIYKKDDYHNVLLDLFKKYGPVVRQTVGPGSTIVHVFDPVDARKVFSSEGTMPMVEPLQETTRLYRERKGTSPGLGNSNGEEWSRLRSAIRKLILQPKAVQTYLPQVNQISDELVTRLKKRRDEVTGEVTDVREEVGKWSREVSGWICFEKRLNSFGEGEGEAEAAKMIEINRRIFQLSCELKFSLPIYKFLPCPKWRELVRLEDTVHRHVVKLLETAIEDMRKKSNFGGGSFLSYLLSREELSEKDVEILTLSIFGDGLSTTVPSLLYNLYCLAVNREVQSKLREEVRKATGGGDYISGDIIDRKLQLVKACVKETFRLYPIGTEISRIIQSDLILSNYRVPKGTHVHLNQVVHFRSAEYFENAELFKPERWLRDGREDTDPLLLVPFGHGTRSCAGRRFAEQDLYVSISKILLNFDLRYSDKLPPLRQTYRLLLFPEEPLHIEFHPLKT